METVAVRLRRDDTEHLLAVAAAFDAAGRQVPGHILRRLWGVRSCWKNRKGVPPQVIAACTILDRLAEA